MRPTVCATSQSHLDRGEITAPRSLRPASRFEQRFGIERHRRERIVDVVRHATRHLPQRPQPFLLQDGLLALPEVLVRLLQGTVELSLVRSESDNAHSTAAETRSIAAETLGRLARGHSTPNTRLSANNGATTNERKSPRGVGLGTETSSERCSARTPTDLYAAGQAVGDQMRACSGIASSIASARLRTPTLVTVSTCSVGSLQAMQPKSIGRLSRGCG